MACPRCNERIKDWDGADPDCGFPHGTFTPGNWNCATLNALRDLADESRVWCDDNSAAVLPAGDGFVLLRWYKNRGCTEDARWLDFGNDDPERLTLEQAEACLRWTRGS